MMGQHGGDQDRLFYSFNLDEHVPADHLLRGIHQFLDLGDLRRHLAPFYSHTGRPSIDPELMIRKLLVGYCFEIRSERALCEQVHLNLAYRWFCRLGLEDKVPDHSTFSKNRHGRFRESDLFRHVFEGVVPRCMSEGLIRGEGFAIDASVVKADANRQRGVAAEQPMDWMDPALGTRAVKEYLQALEQDGQVGLTPKNLSLTDPAARWTAAPGGPAFYAYSTNYLIDVHAGVIVDVEATAAYRTEEVEATKTMIDRVEERFDLKPTRLIGDTAYGAGPMLAWLVDEKHIEPHIPVWDKTQRTDDSLSSSAFTWDEERNEYRCPQGHALRSEWRAFAKPRTHITQDGTIVYRSRQSDCAACPLKSRCCPNTPRRKIARSVHEAARDVARDRCHRQIPAVPARSEEGRSPVRPHETHPARRTVATTRTKRSARRVPAHRHCTEPQTLGDHVRIEATADGSGTNLAPTSNRTRPAKLVEIREPPPCSNRGPKTAAPTPSFSTE